MATKLGSTTISKLYLGVTEITKAYLGSTEVYNSGGAVVDDYAANSISPEFVADFANDYYRVASNDSTFANALTFSRSSSATYVDSSGVIQTAASGVARVGHHVYNGTSWVNEGMLVESESRTNLIEQSEDFSVTWREDSITTASESETGPDGQTVQSITENSDSSIHVTDSRNMSGLLSTGAGTLSLYAKNKSGTRYLQLRPLFQGAGVAYANFDLINGQVVSGGTGGTDFVLANIEDVGGGWYRCSMTADYSSSGAGMMICVSNSTGEIPNYSGDGTSGFYIWGAQMEQGSTPSSYIPTSGSTVTRAGDSLSIPFANTIPASTDISYSYIGKSTFVDNNAFAQLTFYEQNGFENNLILSLNVGVGNRGDFYHRFDGVLDRRGSTTDAGINAAFNLATRANATEIQIAQDGVLKTAATSSGVAPTLTGSMVIASHGSAASGMTLKLFRGWSADIGTAGIEEASS